MMKFLPVLTVILLGIVTLAPNHVHSARILSAAFVSSKSHKITYDPILIELAKRGHKVTVIAPFVTGKKMDNLIEHKTIEDEDQFEKDMKMPNIFEMKEKGEQLNPFTMLDPFEMICRMGYQHPKIKQAMNEKWDLVIMPGIFNECMGGFVHKLNTSLVIVSPVSAPNWLTSILGTPTPTSFVPTLFASFGQKMNFYERTINLLMTAGIGLVQDFLFKPRMESVYRDELNDPTLPNSDEVYRNASLVISNSHLSISLVRPFMPDIVEVGGMHCRPAEPLPKELEDFAKSSGEDGFILFSMGSALKGSTMPEKYRQIFLKAFGRLKQKVLWKWETEKMEGLPANVKLSKWLPQQDVLGHSKIKLFITHGGMGSTTEAIYHGVPLLGIPMYGDQLNNMKKSEAQGFALMLELTELTEDGLYDAIQKMLRDQTYGLKVKKLSTLFKDQPDKPLDRAVFWIEYVLRHKGAPHLRSPARDLNFLQYHSIDSVAFILGVLALVLYLLLKSVALILCKISSLLFGSKKKNTTYSNGKKTN